MHVAIKKKAKFGFKNNNKRKPFYAFDVFNFLHTFLNSDKKCYTCNRLILSTNNEWSGFGTIVLNRIS
jgi:hypothetical protein